MTQGEEPEFDITKVYASVGHAITRWEILEAQLAYLYSVFVGKPGELDTLERYGKLGTIFTNRMTELERAGILYLKDQAKEANLASLVFEVKGLATKRHNIAHGVVTSIQSISESMRDADGKLESRLAFWVVPPYYSVMKLNKGKGIYFYGPASIDDIALEFHVATQKVDEFIATLIR
jgi:hypothetical protein